LHLTRRRGAVAVIIRDAVTFIIDEFNARKTQVDKDV
jgi:hypothetical protein